MIITAGRQEEQLCCPEPWTRFRHAQRSERHEPAGQESHGICGDPGTPSRRTNQPLMWLPANTRSHIFVGE